MTAVLLNIEVFWDVRTCRLVAFHRHILRTRSKNPKDLSLLDGIQLNLLHVVRSEAAV
jgi:hypothetical protein